MDTNENDMQGGMAGRFAFSGVRPEKLGACEYTLATALIDVTGSTSLFADQLQNCVVTSVEACRRSPHSENILFRAVEFNTKVTELHGFMELSRIDASQYTTPKPKGLTALYDAVFASVCATNEYARTLTDQNFNVNGIVFVATDGAETPGCSLHTRADIAAEIARGVKEEALESLIVVLVGINAAEYRAELEQFKADAKLAQYVDIADASPASLAKLARFISQSVSQQSQARGTGGPSQTVTF